MTTLILNSELQGGKYTIKKMLGQGGFGITYLAQHNLLNRQVAIKEFFMKDYCIRVSSTNTMQVGVPEKKIFVERFRTQFICEAQKIASLNHDNIIKIHDIFEENNTAYYVMEYHENGSLADLISRHPNGLSEEMAIAYITEVASAVDYIHGNRMMHLDIKPANILLNDKNSPILIDFGSSRLYNPDGNLDTTTLVGVSEGYAPIEQYMPGGVSHFCPQTDIYSLAATLYTLLKGNRPLNAFEIRQAGLPSLQASANVGSAIKMAMSNDIEQRPASVKHFVDLLLSNQDTIVLPPSAPQLIPVEPKFDEKDCFVILECSKTSVYVGEQIRLSVILYWRSDRLRVKNLPVNLERPIIPGFQSMYFHSTPTTPTSETDHGIEYKMSTLAQFNLIPEEEGYLTISPFPLDVQINVLAFVLPDGSFDPNRDDFYRNMDVHLSTSSCVIYADKKYTRIIKPLGDFISLCFFLNIVPIFLTGIVIEFIAPISRIQSAILYFCILLLISGLHIFSLIRVDKAKEHLLDGNYSSVKKNIRIAFFSFILYVVFIVSICCLWGLYCI